MASYTISIEFKGQKSSLLNITIDNDGSIYFSDLVSRRFKNPKHNICFPYVPVGSLNDGKSVDVGKSYYSASGVIKISHHRTGIVQVSSGSPSNTKIVSLGQKLQLDAYVQSCYLGSHTVDGPIYTGVFWGLNNISYRRPKTSTPIEFNENELRYQSTRRPGKRVDFNIMCFSFNHDQKELLCTTKKEVYYSYHRYKKPLLLKLLPYEEKHGFRLGITCMKGRTDTCVPTGFNIACGPSRWSHLHGGNKTMTLSYPYKRINGREETSLNFFETLGE